MKIKKKLFEPVFGTGLYFAVGKADSAFIQELGKWVDAKLIEDDFIGRNGFSMVLTDDKDGSKSHLIWLKDTDIPTMAHEIAHLVNHVFREVGVSNEDEVFAYYLEYWMRRIMGVISKSTK